MKIVNRKEFLELPSGTVYCKYFNPDGFGNLSIKYDTKYDENNVGMDWLYMELSDFDDHVSSNERYDKLGDMVNLGMSFPLKLDTVTRDGLFEDEQLFAIYDVNDVNLIIEALKSTLK